MLQSRQVPIPVWFSSYNGVTIFTADLESIPYHRVVKPTRHS